MSEHDSNFYQLPFPVKGLDTSTGNQIDLNKFFEEKKGKRLKDIEMPVTYEDFLKVYGGRENLPQNLFGDSDTKLKLNIPEGKELKMIEGEYVLLDKERPKGVQALAAGALDKFNMLIRGKETDLDKLGGGYVKTDDGRVYYDPYKYIDKFDPSDPANVKLSPSQLLEGQKRVEEQFGEPLTMSEIAEEYIDLQDKLADRQDKRSFKKARKAALEGFATYALTEPVRQMYLNKAAEDAQNRYIRGRFALEATPTKIQDIMTAKQAQQGIAALSEAERAKAVAEQQKAANEFGAPQVTLARNVRFANASFKA